MKAKVVLLALFLLKVSAQENIYDCKDAEDRLRCKKSCPGKKQIPDKTCPFNRICCLGKPNSIFMPLRDAPFYKVPNSDFVFPDSVLNYIKNRFNKTISKEPANEQDGYWIQDESSDENKKNAVTHSGSHERKSVKYCKKYTELTYDYLHASPLLPKMLPFTLPMDNCLPSINPLIVGGRGVARGEFPHMAALGYNKTDFIDYLCGGTLISNKYILTAGHCVNTRWGQPVVVMLGSTALYSAECTSVEVAEVIPHPDYKASAYYNDIALVKLKEAVKFSHYIRPACLAQPKTTAHDVGSVTIATGWGKTGQVYEASLNLLKVLLKILNSTECEEYYASDVRFSSLSEGINENLLCATGYKSKYHDTCQGDSGGPLQSYLPGHKCMHEVVGITSFGKSCGTAIPAVYTKVAPYILWIENIVWP